MGSKIKPLSWGRRLAREAIRIGKDATEKAGGSRRKHSYDALKKSRKHYASMARKFKKKG